MPYPSIIAVDGPAGSGKSAVSSAVARQLNYLFVDTGAFYRAITLLALEHGIDTRSEADTTTLAQQAELDLEARAGHFAFLANGTDITVRLNTPEVDAHVSYIARTAGVRTALFDAQRSIAGRGKVIMAGRDIGTVVLPDADLKLYIDASLEARATRRYRQRLAEGRDADLNTIREGLRQRDEIDSGRAVAPLTRAEDAIYLDTSDLTLEEAIAAMLHIIETT